MSSRRRVIPSLAALCALLLSALAGSGASANLEGADAAPAKVVVTYTWPVDGYAGWERDASAGAKYRLDAAPGGRPGLWISPESGEHSPGFGGWTLAAPGTTTISGAQVAVSYAAKLLAHHCVQVGLGPDAWRVCEPRNDDDDALVKLSVPAGAAALSFRVFMPECAKKPAHACSKNVRAPGAYARLHSARVTLVDSDLPTLELGGALAEQRGRVLENGRSYALTIDAADEGAGVARVRVDAGGRTVFSRAAACNDLHRSNDLGARPCPAAATFSAEISPGDLPEGNAELTVIAVDATGHETREPLAVIVDRTAPAVEATRAFAEATILDSDRLEAGVRALDEDPGGLRSLHLERGDRSLLAETLDCTSCPTERELVGDVDVSGWPEGSHEIVAHAIDAAGNASAPVTWSVLIDRTPPGAPSNIRVSRFEEETETVWFRWDGATDGDGSGAAAYEYRYSLDGEIWSEWIVTPMTAFSLEGTPLGEIVDLEVRALDGAGNTGESANAELTVFAASEPSPQEESPSQDAGTEIELPADDRERAVSIARADPQVTSLVGDRTAAEGDVMPLSAGNGDVIGAQVALTWADPMTLEAAWPSVTWDESARGYTQDFSSSRATGVTGLDVLVDLRSSEVIGIEPAGADLEFAQAGSAFGFRSVKDITLPPRNPQPDGIDEPGSAINLRYLSGNNVPVLGSDLVLNWDFKERVSNPMAPGARFKADWPVNLLFIGEADIHKAKDIWNKGKARRDLPGWPLLASAKFGLVINAPPAYEGQTRGLPVWGDGTGTLWDSDKGVYTGTVCAHKIHYRVYAPKLSVDSMYNLSLGYYVVGTSHQDHLEECEGEWYGGSEAAERAVYNEAKAHPGWTAAYSVLPMLNRDRRGRLRNRIYWNDGKATLIVIGTPRDMTVSEGPRRPRNTGKPTVSGETSVEKTLTADPGEWSSSAPPSFEYRWLRCDASGANCKKVVASPPAGLRFAAAADGATHTLGEADVGSRMRVDVTARTATGIRTVRSEATDVVRGGSACGLSGDVAAAGPGSPPNDDFSRALRLTGSSGSLTGTLVGATVQNGGTPLEASVDDPDDVGDYAWGNDHTHSVWYCFTAPATATYTFSTKGSPPPFFGDGSWSEAASPPFVGIWKGNVWAIWVDEEPANGLRTGNAAPEMKVLGSNKMISWANAQSGSYGDPGYEVFTKAMFRAEAGVQYLIMVTNIPGDTADEGAFKLSWYEERDPDEDGVPVPEDNCPDQPNGDQGDYDGNGSGNACDPAPIGIRVVNSTRYRVVSYVPRCPLGFDRSGTGTPCWFFGSLLHQANWMPDTSIIDCGAFATCSYAIKAHTGPSFQLRAVGTYPSSAQPLGYQGFLNGGTLSNGGCTSTSRPDRFCVVPADPWASDLVFRDDYDENRDGSPDPVNDSRDRWCKPRSHPSANQNQCHVVVHRAVSEPYGPYTYTVYVKPHDGVLNR